MELTKGESNGELSQAYALALNHTFSITSYMSLNCAMELGIADLIDSHGGPMPLSELATSIPIHPKKVPFLRRLMRLLVIQGVFAAVQGEGDENSEIAYLLTPFSRLLLTKGANMSAFFRFQFHPVSTKPLRHLSAWFRTEASTPFEIAYGGKSLWDLAAEQPEINDLFNEGLAFHSRVLVKAILTECSQVFQGLKSLLDVGGGTGTAARMIAEAFPEVKCTVFDLPHVVATIPESIAVDTIGGDMFKYIPPANATLLKDILHDWSDEDCIKILKRCKDAIPPKEEGGKVIIVDMVINTHGDNHKIIETQLLFDMSMANFGGKEREEHEWQKIFHDAGFKDYKILPIQGFVRERSQEFWALTTRFYSGLTM